MSLIGLLLMALDKSRAQHKGWRIPERLLFLWAFIGGALGIWLGMYLFRHKTLHASFVWGIPAIIALHALIAVAAWRWDLVMKLLGL